MGAVGAARDVHARTVGTRARRPRHRTRGHPGRLMHPHGVPAMSRNDMGGARRGVMAHSIGWPNATEFYLSIEWYSDEDRAHALGILFGAALNALHEVDGQAVWEHRPGRSGTGWTTAG